MKPPTELPTVPRSASDEHDFYVLGSRGFEHLVRALHGAQPDVTIAHLYGPDGQAQFGADHVALRHEDGEAVIEVGQSKAYRRFTARQIREAVKDFTDHWESHWRDKKVRRFILFVGCVIKSRQAQDEIIAQTQALAKRGVAFEVWDASTIHDRLGSAPGVVRVHLGQEYYAKLFGETVGPLTGLQRDLQRGDRGALQVGGYVARLNRAETAEVAELRRRVRRGETQEVMEELEDMLFRSPAAQAAAPETRAQQLRLLAGLLIRRDEHVRAKALLDEADGLDGDSRRLRAVLTLEAVGPEAALAETQGDDEAGVVEVRAVARLRQGDPDGAFGEIAPHLATDEPSTETLRLAALSKLLLGDREEALSLGERAAAREPDSRACRHVVGIAHYHRALSPAAGISVGEWPEPVEQPLVATSDEARGHLEQAERIFSKLKEDPSLDDHQSMVMWHFAALACMPWRREDAVAAFRTMQANGTLPLPLIAWCMARGLDFDSDIAAAACAHRLAEAPDDLETRLITVAVNTFRRDYPCARRLLEEGREQLLTQGHKTIHDYWSAVLDFQTRRPAAADVLVQHPSLQLRRALATRSKKKRLAALEQLLLDQLSGEGDPPVILASTQLLLQGGWHRTAAKAAPYLIERIATGEALAVAAQALHHNGRFREAAEALDRTDSFPDGRLPIELERMRAESLAASGNLIAARQASVELASATGNERDIWRSIEFHLASGDERSALALYDRHEDVLARPAPGHVMLARAVLHTNREAAARITRQIAQATPDELVTAVFDLAAKLRLQAEQNTLVSRIAALGATGGGGVQMLHVDEVVAWIKRRNEQIEEIFEKYANGHLPAHMMASFREGALALTHLSSLLRPPPPDVRLPILSTRYGRRYDEDIWPEGREDVVLIADVTALLTAHGLDVLDTVERYFKPIHVALDISNALLALRSDLEPAQPDRVAATRRVVARIEEGGIAVRGPGAQIDAFTVLFELEGREPEATLNLPPLMEPILAGMSEARRNTVREALGTTLHETPAGAIPPPGSIVNIDETMAVTLEEAGALATSPPRSRLRSKRGRRPICASRSRTPRGVSEPPRRSPRSANGSVSAWRTALTRTSRSAVPPINICSAAVSSR